MIASGNLAAIHIGALAPLPGRNRLTGFRKMPVSGTVQIMALGIAGDVQGNLKVHGGLEKAVYGYPISGYAGWQTEFPSLVGQMQPGGMGENLVISGMDEDTVHIGDIIRCGTALLQVSQSREPCSTFAAVHGTPRVVRAMTRSGRCGWYYRVLEPGIAAAGDSHDIIERLNPAWPLRRFAAFTANKAGTIDAIAELTTLPGLTPAWQAKAAKALAAQQR